MIVLILEKKNSIMFITTKIQAGCSVFFFV